MLTPSYIYQGILAPGSILLPVVTGIIAKWRTNKSMVPVFGYLASGALINFTAVILAFHSINNLPLLHFYTIVEFAWLSMFFRRALHSYRPGISRFIRVSQLIFPVVCVLNVFLLEPFYSYNSNTRTLEAMLIIVFCLLFLDKSYNNTACSRTSAAAELWITCGLLIYFSSAFAQFALLRFITKLDNHGFIMVIWNVHATLVMVMYLLIAKGFLKARANG